MIRKYSQSRIVSKGRIFDNLFLHQIRRAGILLASVSYLSPDKNKRDYVVKCNVNRKTFTGVENEF
jgi:hypothetical protein